MSGEFTAVVIGDLDAALGFDPFVGFGEASISAKDGDDALSGRSDVVGVFEDEFQNSAEIGAALGVKSGGAGMTVNGRPIEPIAAVEFDLDGLRTVPVDEELLDGFAVRMLADEAFAGVALEVGLRLG